MSTANENIALKESGGFFSVSVESFSTGGIFLRFPVWQHCLQRCLYFTVYTVLFRHKIHLSFLHFLHLSFNCIFDTVRYLDMVMSLGMANPVRYNLLLPVKRKNSV